MNFLNINRKIFSIKAIILLALMLFCNVNVLAVEAQERYLILNPVSGLDPDLSLFINQKSLNLDLAKTSNIRVKLKIDGLYSSLDSVSSFTVSLFEVLANGDKKFISSQNLTLAKNHSGNRILSVDVGHFAQPSKNVMFEVYDTLGNLINSYELELEAYNLESQVMAEHLAINDSVECDADKYGDCQIDYLLQRVKFEARPQTQISTRVTKGEDGLYKVTIPIPKEGFKPLKLKPKVKTPLSITKGTVVNVKNIEKVLVDEMEVSHLKVLGPAVFQSNLTSVLLNGQSSIVPTHTIMRIEGMDGAVDITKDPQIAPGSDGQLLILRGSSNTKTVKINDGKGLDLLSYGSFMLGEKDTITLVFDSIANEWVEISRSNNQ